MKSELWKKLCGRSHSLCSQLGMNEDERRAMLVQSFGVESTSQLKYGDLLVLCDRLENLVSALKNEEDRNLDNELDHARKRLIASIGAYLRASNQSESIDIIKAIACRATKAERFNQITVSDLRSLSATFRAKANKVKAQKQDEIKRIAILN